MNGAMLAEGGSEPKIVSTRGANDILHDQAEYWFPWVRQPGLASCADPRGRKKSPVASGGKATDDVMGVASKSVLLGPETCEALSRSVG